MVKKIQFVNSQTNAPLVTIKGPMLDFLMERSGLIQQQLELSNTTGHFLKLPIGDFPTDRRTVFTKILKGLPVGKISSRGGIEYYPLGSEEERAIAQEVDRQMLAYGGAVNREFLLNKERERVLYEILQYLLLEPSEIASLLIIEPAEGVHYSEDDEIDHMIQNHIMWLALTHQGKKLTNAEKAWFDSQAPGLSNAYMANHGNEGFSDPNSYTPVDEEKTAHMPTRNYERYLRTVYMKKPRKPLSMTNYQLNILTNENPKRERANERNNSAVVFYNPSKPVNNTRRRANKKNKTKNNKRNAW